MGGRRRPGETDPMTTDATITITDGPTGCLPRVLVSPAPSNEREVAAAIVAAHTALCERLRAAGLRVGKWDEPSRSTAQHAASAVLGPIMIGINSWLVIPVATESVSAYARRASRCAAGRCAEAGVTAPAAIAHNGAETVGMSLGHGSRAASAVRTISAIERTE